MSSHQRSFAFLERRSHRERTFKQLIVLTTCLAVAFILKFVPWGRYLSATILSSARQVGRQAIGGSKARSETDDLWKRFRQLQIEETRPRVERFFAQCEPAYQRLLRYAAMDPEHGLLRWGNFNWTLLLSSAVFEVDDEGRSYRLRPSTRSIWLRHLDVPDSPGAPMFFLVPDGPGLADAIRGTTASPLETSRQKTNSWGLRGPEPDPDAPVRGMVLGDSYMQGMFIGDDETPPECLRNYLQEHLGVRASILNTGVMGYSPEQYYHSLIAFADRFRPQFVVVSIYANDFGNAGDVVTRGVGDWPEAKYWLEKITEYCRVRHWPSLIVPVPYERSILTRRPAGHYPGALLNVLDVESLSVLNPTDDFVDAQLEWLARSRREGRKVEGSPLFNEAIQDDHFSAAGSKVWAASVGHRIIRLLEKDHDLDRGPPSGPSETRPSAEHPRIQSNRDP